MTYQPRPLISDDTLLKSRDKIREDFEIIQNRFNDNHVDFNDGLGKHKFLNMPVQSPDPSSSASEGLLFCKTINGSSELQFARDANATTYTMTGPAPIQSGTGQTFLPGLTSSMIMKWGVTAATNSNQDIVFATEFPNNLYQVQLTPYRATSSPGSTFGFWVSTAGFSKAGFTIVNNSGHTFAWFWTAIGD